MPNNILANKKQACVALQTKSFAELGLNNAVVTKRIFLIDGNAPLNVYDPLSNFNGIAGFVSGKGYEVTLNIDTDLTGILSPPNVSGSDGALLTLS